MRRTSLFALLLTGCLTPRYVRPETPVDAAWPEAAAAPAEDESAAGWRAAFPDPALQGLVERALVNNRDLQRTALAVEQARVQLRLSDAALAPGASLEGSFSTTHVPASVSPFGEAYEVNQFGVGPQVSWELDLFGRLRSQRRGAAERLVAAAEDWRAARLTLIADVGQAALQERVLARQLQLAEEALVLRREAAELVRVQVDAGLVSELDLKTAESLVAAAEVSRAQLERSTAQGHNALVLLVGESVDRLPAADDALEDAIALTIPAGLPSDLLTRRPDIRAAEHRLVAAHADIGAARAAMFPSISLTGGINTASSSLLGLFDAGTLAWSVTAPSLTAPIFQFGARRATVRASLVAREGAVAGYEASIQSAFREVADVLVARRTTESEVVAQQRVVDAQRARVELASARYRGGSSAYLEVLDAERERFAAEQSLWSARLARVQLGVTWFKVLGGGAEDQVEVPAWRAEEG